MRLAYLKQWRAENADYRAAWEADHREERLAGKRQWRIDNADLVREQNRAAREARGVENVHVLYGHGLAPGELDRLYDSQGGRCAICDKHAPMRGPGCLHIDHDHATGERRGLICKPCNNALHIVDQVGPSWVLRALAYMGDPPLRRLRATGTDSPFRLKEKK